MRVEGASEWDVYILKSNCNIFHSYIFLSASYWYNILKNLKNELILATFQNKSGNVYTACS